MNKAIQIRHLLSKTDLSDGASIERYAMKLKGMTFRDVLALGITPSDYTEKEYNRKRFKGGMGNLLEERYFGYRANSEDEPDFREAGVELKATCFDVKKNGDLSAGERLSLTMIPYDRDLSLDFFESHLWEKCHSILLVEYKRDRTKDKYDQEIYFVSLFTPPEEDLEIICDDYRTIVEYIQAGRADELSESLTTYLGAATKGETAEKSWVDQYYPFIEEDGTRTFRRAKKRAFSFKRQYMDYVLHHYLMDEEDDSEEIVRNGELETESFKSLLENRIGRFIGQSGPQIAEHFGIPFTGNKAQYPVLAYRMLGVRSSHAKEFIKAGISVRAIRREETGRFKESLSFPPFEFMDLLQETWETSTFRSYLESTKFFFVVFRKRSDGLYHLEGSLLWNVNGRDIEGAGRSCWETTRRMIEDGIELRRVVRSDGGMRVCNDLPGQSENPMFHVRPHARKRAYLLSDGTRIGDVEKDASPLPDGRWMTKQSFWINNSFLSKLFDEAFEDDARS